MNYIEKYHYRLLGNSRHPPLVFLHGLMGFSSNWGRIAQAFANDHYILLFDQRGHGRSQKPPTRYKISDYSEDLFKIISELQWSSVIIVGHSMGGKVALHFASSYSHLVKALIIEDTPMGLSTKNLTWFESLFKFIPTPFASRKEAHDFFKNEFQQKLLLNQDNLQLGEFLMANLAENEAGFLDWRFSKSAILETVAHMNKKNYWQEWKNLRVPTLALRGAHSVDLDESCWLKMQALNPSIQFKEILNSGHLIHFDQPDLFIKAIKDFLQKLF